MRSAARLNPEEFHEIVIMPVFEIDFTHLDPRKMKGASFGT